MVQLACVYSLEVVALTAVSVESRRVTVTRTNVYHRDQYDRGQVSLWSRVEERAQITIKRISSALAAILGITVSSTTIGRIET
jgi:hypothetical protein